MFSKNFSFVKSLYRKAYDELCIIIDDHEKCLFLSNANYVEEGEIHTGLILVNDRRVIYTHRKKGKSAFVLKFSYDEISNIFFDKGLIYGDLNFVNILYELKFQSVLNADGKNISKHISEHLEQIRSSKSQESFDIAVNQEEKEKSILTEVFNPNKGWIFNPNQIKVEMVEKSLFKLIVMGLEINICEKNKFLSKSGKSLKISEIVLFHKFKDIDIKYHNSLLKKTFSNGMISGYSLSNMDEVVVSTSFPTFPETTSHLLQKQIIFRLLFLLEEIKEFQKSDIVVSRYHNSQQNQALNSSTNKATVAGAAITWSDAFDFLNSAADVVQTVADIVEVVSGDNE